MKHGQPHWVRENTNEFDIDGADNSPDSQKDASTLSDNSSPEYFQKFITNMETSPKKHHHNFSSCQGEEEEPQKLQFIDEFLFDQEMESPGDNQQEDFVDQLISNFDIADTEVEKFEMFEYLSSHKDLIDDENIVRSIIQQTQSLMEDIQPSEFTILKSESEVSAEDNESEQFHFERMMHIPNAPTMSFTHEERLCVKHLLQIDQDSRVALKDTMRSFGNSIVNQVSLLNILGSGIDFNLDSLQ
jgi:hypothetical protein